MMSYKQLAVDYSFLKKLQTLDWQTIRYHLLNSDEGRDFTPAQATRAIWQYGLFLFLAKQYPSMRLVPTEEIDAVLHAHIATDRQYQDDCQTLLGGCVHHSAGLGTRGDRKEWLEAFDRTKQLFEKTFGRGAMGHSAPAACDILLAFN
jgi:hypothetical protein